jgi:NADPH:quinone reductase-like Zn-dependent oxidoreductase
MRAAVVEAAGSPPRPAEADDPAREDGTAFVAVAAAALNPVEIRVASGRHPREAQPPHIPGLEGERAAVPEESLAELPDDAGDDLAAAVGVVGMGASRVVGAGRSAERLQRVRELGADEVVELADDDLTDAFEQAAGGQLDIVIDSLWGEPSDGGASCDRHGGAPREHGPGRGQDASPGRKLVIAIGHLG